MAAAAAAAVSVRQLGVIGYHSCLTLQQQLARVYHNKHSGKVGEILLLEHTPVYTFGLREEISSDTLQLLRSLGADVCKTERGGLTTFHGPGQLVCYPVVNLSAIKMGIRNYICALEQAMINSVQRLGVTANRSEHTGVWVGENKLGAIGVQVTRGVTMHGLALNCTTDLAWYHHIVPCGLTDKGVTSLSILLGRNVPVSEVSPYLLDSLTDSLGVHVEH